MSLVNLRIQRHYGKKTCWNSCFLPKGGAKIKQSIKLSSKENVVKFALTSKSNRIFARWSVIHAPLAIKLVCCSNSAISIKHTLSSVNTLCQAASTRQVLTGRDDTSVGETDSQSNLSTFQRGPKKQTLNVNFSVCEKNFRMFALPDNHHTASDSLGLYMD